MRNLDTVAEQLFNEIRGRYSSVTTGDAEGNITSAPSLARFYEFDFKSGNTNIGKVSVSLDEKSGVTIMYNKDFTEEVGAEETKEWYDFLKQMRMFSKKRLLNFEVRDINRTNFTKRDYASMAVNRGETQMAESKMYGTHKTSFQKFGNAKLSIKHTGDIIEGESRNKKIGSLFIENAQGEKFKYPFKHLSGARAMAIHVSEGGHPYDDFGKHITSLSEELSNLRKFKTYMGRSSVMAESLAEHMGTVNERITTVKKRIQTLQKPTMYKEALEEFVVIEESEVPADVASNWIDQLTIKQFNEDLKDVFPYIYKLVGEATQANEMDFDDLIAEADVYPPRGDMEMDPSNMRPQAKPAAPKTSIRPQARPQVYDTPAQAIQAAEENLAAQPGQVKKQFEKGEDYTIHPVQGGFIYKLAPTVDIGASPSGGTRGIGGAAYESQIDAAFDKLLGQFADNFSAQIEGEQDTDEGNAFAHAVRQAKMDGKKKGDKVKGPDGDEIVLASKEQKTPLGEFILSYYDRQQGVFPKGETAVLTMVEKSYGDRYIKPASQFIERLGQVYEKYQQKKLGQVNLDERELAGDFESQFRRIAKRGGNVAVSIHRLLKDSGLDADQIMGFNPQVDRTKAQQFQSGRQQDVLQKAKQALGGAQGGQAQPAAGSAQGGQDLGNGFQKIKHPQYGDAILDTQSGSVIFVNAGKLRSPGKYAVLQKNGEIQTTNQLGPMSTQAMQDAGLGESQNLNRIQELAGLR